MNATFVVETHLFLCKELGQAFECSESIWGDMNKYCSYKVGFYIHEYLGRDPIYFAHNVHLRRRKWILNILEEYIVQSVVLANRGHKKVLLRERKRHTARCVANTPYVVLTGYPPRGGSGYPPGGVGGSGYPPGGGVRVPPLGGSGYPPGGCTRSGTPPGGSGYPRGGVWVPPRGVYPVRYPPGGSGYPPGGSRYPPGGVLGQVPPRGGYPDPPSPPCGQTNTCENSTFPSYYVRGR